jgi:glyoxylase-like metal-dependent hydrolase (beta-lactamase superfamily II)
MTAFSPRVATAALAAVLAIIPLSAQPVNPIVREGATEKISPHVYVIPDASVSLVPNVGIIVGTKGTFVVDTGLGPKNGQAVLREVDKVKQGPELYLATTHFHPEHDLGATAFPPATKMLRSTDQQKDIDEFGLQLARTFAQRGPAVAELLKDAEFRKADTLFEREQTVDLGGVRIRLIAMGANHTRGDTVFFVEPDGILFSGDIAMKPLPAFASPYSTMAHWRESLDALEKLAPKKIVPSHGPMGEGTTLIGGYRELFATLQSRAAELKKAGKSLDETVATLSTELAAKYPDRNRLGGAIRAAYNEAK